jgi:hypothetical protein
MTLVSAVFVSERRIECGSALYQCTLGDGDLHRSTVDSPFQQAPCVPVQHGTSLLTPWAGSTSGLARDPLVLAQGVWACGLQGSQS